MANSKLPERASLEYLKKLAKERLRELRRNDPRAQLATALLAVAQDHGYSSWRALKAEVDLRQQKDVARFFAACTSGDVDIARGLLDDRSMARVSNPDAPHGGWTGLHAAARAGHLPVVKLLLEHGADPNAREAGDNTYPLHWAAANGQVEIARALLDAGGDVHGLGDVHELDVIGWATLYHAPGDDPALMSAERRELVDLLLARGARHHIFSVISVGELKLIQELVEQNPDALYRRLSRFEKGHTPLHFAISRKRYDILELLIELGADLEATDMAGQTALAFAMLRGDRTAIGRLHAAGATPRTATTTASDQASMAKLAESVKKVVPMIMVRDVARALDWYVSIGFKELARFDDDGLVNFGMVSFGNAEVMLNMHGNPGARDVRLWFYTDQIDNLYQALKSRQLEAAQAALAGKPGEHAGIEFEQDLEHMFYGARQFCIRDLNGYELYFIQHEK